ncbi:alpha/beta fold hydrolase [Arenimonas fontis]|nr:alpha/beta fold hydrolase [Arenimonas fontis]
MAETRVHAGHAAINGVNLYYEDHGPREGMPLVLLNGGGSTIETTWGRALPLLARTRRVIALDEEGHGRSSFRDGPSSFEASADDVAALLEHLQVERADLMGFSNGASIALQVAIRHPRRVRRLVFASSMTRRDGAPAAFWAFMDGASLDNMPDPLKQAFLAHNPDPEALRRMHDRDAERMRHFRDVPDEQVRAVQAPVLVLAGDRDIVTPEHAAELARLFPRGRLMILPGGHGEYLGEQLTTLPGSCYPQRTLPLVLQFLDEAGEKH